MKKLIFLLITLFWLFWINNVFATTPTTPPNNQTMIWPQYLTSIIDSFSNEAVFLLVMVWVIAFAIDLCIDFLNRFRFRW